MSQLLNRALQLRILEALAVAYPEGIYDLAPALATPTENSEDLAKPVLVNVQYLAGHGLVASGYSRRGTLSNNGFLPAAETTITASGLDFLQDDGGLGAILSVLTIRFEPATLAALMQAKVDASNLPAEEKSRIKAALKSLSQEAWSEATKRLVSAALDHWPQALDWLQTLRG